MCDLVNVCSPNGLAPSTNASATNTPAIADVFPLASPALLSVAPGVLPAPEIPTDVAVLSGASIALGAFVVWLVMRRKR